MERIHAYQTYLVREEKSPLTVEKYTRDARRFLLWLGDRVLDKSQTLAYKEALAAAFQPASVNSMLAAMNSFLRFIGRGDCRVKALRRQRRMFRDGSRDLTREEYIRLVEAAGGNERLGLLMQAICSTGIRVSEHRFLTVEAARQGSAQVRLKGKHRVVLLPRKLCKALLAYARKRRITRGSLFITASGKPLDRSTVWAEMKKLCARAGVAREKVFPHNLRHLFALTYYAGQKDIVRLADILGHSSIDTTRIYTLESGQTHRMQIEKMRLLYIT